MTWYRQCHFSPGPARAGRTTVEAIRLTARHIDLGPTVVGRVVAVTGLVSEWPIDQIDLGEQVACRLVAKAVAARLSP